MRGGRPAPDLGPAPSAIPRRDRAQGAQIGRRFDVRWVLHGVVEVLEGIRGDASCEEQSHHCCEQRVVQGARLDQLRQLGIRRDDDNESTRRLVDRSVERVVDAGQLSKKCQRISEGRDVRDGPRLKEREQTLVFRLSLHHPLADRLQTRRG